MSAQSSSDFTYRRGETIEESVLPATPQAASASGYFSSAFSYSTGSAQIDVPFYTLAGHELSIPIGLRYSGGSGIKLDEVGLVTDEMKERQKIAEKDIDCIDFGARLYSPVIRRWTTPDPKSEDWYGISPYSYCAGDPVNFVDPDGSDWYSYEKTIENEDGEARTETLYAWTDATSQEELDKLGIIGIYRGEAIIVFNGYENESLTENGYLSEKDGSSASDTA